MTILTFHMSDGELLTLKLPGCLNFHAEVRRYLADGIGFKDGKDKETFYPASAILKIDIQKNVIQKNVIVPPESVRAQVTARQIAGERIW